MRSALLFLTFSLCTVPSYASELDISSIQGVYRNSFENGDITRQKFHGEDILEIVRITDKTAYIRTHLDFFNGHMCGIWGIADAVGTSLVYSSKNIASCRLTISFSMTDVTLSDLDGKCRIETCGSRGGYENAKFYLNQKTSIRYMPRILASTEYNSATRERGETELNTAK
jgi:hypothetical protein